MLGALYLPNGNPHPGPIFDYKLRRFKRLHDDAVELLELDVPVVLAGDYNVMPTEIDVYKPERWTNEALFRVEVRDACKKGSRARMISASFGSGRARSLASSQGACIHVSVSSFDSNSTGMAFSN